MTSCCQRRVACHAASTSFGRMPTVDGALRVVAVAVKELFVGVMPVGLIVRHTAPCDGQKKAMLTCWTKYVSL